MKLLDGLHDMASCGQDGRARSEVLSRMGADSEFVVKLQCNRKPCWQQLSEAERLPD